ncbi:MULTISPECIES: hypothetical protein [unclassified Brevundimonas]|uniref:hypothetical protein n=1 Tax=unclassified Brevundimonas TaxID=2622653 RepID=UPI0025C11EE0|nr:MULTISPECIES: hypothetical protein [unclassified Brevundimonas]
MKLVAVLGVVGALSACAPLPAEITLQNSFNPADYAWADQVGSNTVSGSALLRTVGGEVRTCGALPVSLIPDVPYTRERMIALYGNAAGGYRAFNAGPPGGVIFINEPFEFSRVGRRTACDASGNFRFAQIPDGSYFVVAEVSWGVPYGSYLSPQGGRLMQRVEVKGGDAPELLLTAN